MLTSTLRTVARRSPTARRHVATQAPRSTQGRRSNLKAPSTSIPSAGLAPEKMRALISLYHQTESFITPTNLSDTIDEVFIYSRERLGILHPSKPELSQNDLWRMLRERRDQPSVAASDARTWRTNAASNGRYTGQWSESQTVREQQVVHALYGVEGVGKPGLEVVEEEHERIQAHIRRDREQQQ